MKAFSVTLTFIGTFILFIVLAGQWFTGAAAIKVLFALGMATAIVLFGWGFIDTFLPPKKNEEEG